MSHELPTAYAEPDNLDADPVRYYQWLTRQVPDMATDELCELVNAGPVSRELQPGEGNTVADLVAATVAELGRRIVRMTQQERVDFHCLRVGRRIPMPIVPRPVPC